jgi:hypothetical protein
MAEDYCRAITEESGRSCCCRSGSIVLDCGFQLAFLLCTHAHTWPFVYLGPSRAIFDRRRTLQKVTTVQFEGCWCTHTSKVMFKCVLLHPTKIAIWYLDTRARARSHTHTLTHLSAMCHNNWNKGDQLLQEQHALFFTFHPTFYEFDEVILNTVISYVIFSQQ